MATDWPRARAGQPLAIAGLFITIAFGVILFLFFQDLLLELLDTAQQYGDSPAASKGNQYLRDTFDAILFVFVGVGVFGLITIAVYRRQGV